MTIPEKLKIGGHLYDVRIVADNFDGAYGITHREENKICISADLPGGQQSAALIHEIFHAMNSEIDHVLLDSLAEQLYQVLSDNDMVK